MELTIKVKKITIVRGRGMDRISLELDGPNPTPAFPENTAEFKTETVKGFAEEWLFLMFGRWLDVVNVEIIDVNTGFVTFLNQVPPQK